MNFTDVCFFVVVHLRCSTHSQVKVVVRAPNGRSITPSITTKPLGSGNKFDISFTPVTEGEHKIDVLLDDKPLKGTIN